MKILFVKVLFISIAQAAGPFALVGRLTNKEGTNFLLLISRVQRIHSLIYKHMLRSSTCLLSLRPLGLVPASGLLWLLPKTAMLFLVDNAALVTAPKKGPSAGTGVICRILIKSLDDDQPLMPLLVA